MFECLVGWPPFCAEDRRDVYRKIVNWQHCLYFPDDVRVGHYAEHLIRRCVFHTDPYTHTHGHKYSMQFISLSYFSSIPKKSKTNAFTCVFSFTSNQPHSLVCNSENRLGRSGAHELKGHPFFAGVDFDNLRRFRAPFEPRLSSDIDTAYFPTEDLEQQAANAMEIDGGLEAAAAPDQQETPEMTLPFIGYTFKRFENNFR